uniref:Uncharacterized protein n=1 Tax=Desertifilum tharense IPPAS B-1220 TaxID=1781255 RepID=A0ACD5GRF5_9CYAN
MGRTHSRFVSQSGWGYTGLRTHPTEPDRERLEYQGRSQLVPSAIPLKVRTEYAARYSPLLEIACPFRYT